MEEIEKLLNENVEKLSTLLQITPSLAKVLLHENKWNTNEVVEQYRNNASNLLVSARIKPVASGSKNQNPNYKTQMCPVCVTVQSFDKFHSLTCSHSFCRECWSMHFEIQINQGK